MPRHKRCRCVEFIPPQTCFRPHGFSPLHSEEICLQIEELEAVRLKDLEELDQETCAAKMQISRPTFQRVLASARKKIATALVEGKGIRIEGGDFKVKMRHFQCNECGHTWEVPCGNGQSGTELKCPVCNSQNKCRIDKKGDGFACSEGHGHKHEGYEPHARGQHGCCHGHCHED